MPPALFFKFHHSWKSKKSLVLTWPLTSIYQLYSNLWYTKNAHYKDFSRQDGDCTYCFYIWLANTIFKVLKLCIHKRISMPDLYFLKVSCQKRNDKNEKSFKTDGRSTKIFFCWKLAWMSVRWRWHPKVCLN